MACELPCSTDTENGYTSEGNEYQSGALIFIFLRASMHLTHNGTFIPAGWRPSSRREVSAPSFSNMYCISSGFSIICKLLSYYFFAAVGGKVPGKFVESVQEQYCGEHKSQQQSQPYTYRAKAYHSSCNVCEWNTYYIV